MRAVSEPTVSPDGQWRWDGHQWVPNQPTTGYPPAPYLPAPAPSSTDGKAVASLVLGLVGLCGIGSLLAVILGHLSRREARQQGRQPSGLALAGIILGYVGLVGVLLLAAFFLVGANVHGEFHTTQVCQVTPTSSSCT
jgi:hypothetical protein